MTVPENYHSADNSISESRHFHFTDEKHGLPLQQFLDVRHFCLLMAVSIKTSHKK